MRLQLVDVVRQHGSHVVLDGVALAGQPGLAARSRRPERLRASRPCCGSSRASSSRTAARSSASPRRSTAGYLPQEHGFPAGESVLGLLARRTGVAAAESALAAAARGPGRGRGRRRRATAPPSTGSSRSAGAISRRVRATMLAEPRASGRARPAGARLSGGEAARLALAAILLSRFDVLLLDEPTNDLDFDGLERLERFVASARSALVVVSHDRAFLDRTVTRIAEIEAGRGRLREWAGGWSDYAAARDAASEGAYTRFSEAQERRRELTSLLSRTAHAGAVGRRDGRPARHARPDDEGAPGRAAARAQRVAREAVRAVAAPARAPGRLAAGEHRRRRSRERSSPRGTSGSARSISTSSPGSGWRSPAATAAASRRCSPRCAATSRSSAGIGRSAARP